MTDRDGAPSPTVTTLGRPRVHLRRTDSTNERARMLAIEGAPHGTLVSAAEQSAGRGRQGRAWVAPPGGALLCSLVLRDPPPLLSLIAGVAVCDAVGPQARVKWPNDVVFERTAEGTEPVEAAGSDPQPGDPPKALALAKLAGILVEGRPQDGWAVLGIGMNVAVRVDRLPHELRERAVSLDLPSSAIEVVLGRLVEFLARRISEPVEDVLEAWRARDVLRGREVSWGAHPAERPSRRDERGGHGEAAGIDDQGRLIVTLAGGATTKLDAGEVHLGPAL